MGLFTHKSDFSQLEWRLFRDSCLNLYSKALDMDNDIGQLKDNNYKVIEFDANSWHTNEDIDNAFLQIAVPYNNCSNLDALRDCIAELNIPDMSDAAMVIRNFDTFIENFGKDYAEGFLDVIALQSRNYLLFGTRLVVMLYSKEDIKLYTKLGGSYVRPMGRD